MENSKKNTFFTVQRNLEEAPTIYPAEVGTTFKIGNSMGADGFYYPDDAVVRLVSMYPNGKHQLKIDYGLDRLHWEELAKNNVDYKINDAVNVITSNIQAFVNMQFPNGNDNDDPDIEKISRDFTYSIRDAQRIKSQALTNTIIWGNMVLNRELLKQMYLHYLMEHLYSGALIPIMLQKLNHARRILLVARTSFQIPLILFCNGLRLLIFMHNYRYKKYN
jgi:hypothetical protein